MLLMYIVAFWENTGMKQTLFFLIFFLHTLWIFMSSNAVWLLSHVVCPGECMEGKKPHLNPKLYSYVISVSAPLQSDPYESSTLS